MADETTQQAAPPVPATIPIPTTEPELPLIPLDESALNPEYDPAKDQRAPFLKTPINPTGPTISPAPTRSVGQVIKEAATENIPQFSSRTVSNPNYGKQSFLPDSEIMTQQQRREAPALAGALDVASELGSPATIGTVAATAGVGEAGVIPKVLSGLFAGQIATSVYDQYPALKDAVNRAQTAKTKEAHDDAFADAQRILTHMGADTVMGLLAAKHGAEGAKEILDTTTGSGVPDQASTFKNPGVEPVPQPEETHPEMNRDTVKQLQKLGYSNQHITNFNIGEIRDILKNQTPAAEHPISKPAVGPEPDKFAAAGGKLVSTPAETPTPTETGATDPIEYFIMSDKIGGKKVRGATSTPEPAALPPQPKLPDTGTYPAIKTDDGGIYVDMHPEGRTHIMFAQEQGIPPERIVSGGWLKDGDYDASERSDAGRWGEQARAKLAVAAKRAPEPEAFAEHGGKFVGKSPEAADKMTTAIANLYMDRDENAHPFAYSYSAPFTNKTAPSLILPDGRITNARLSHSELARAAGFEPKAGELSTTHIDDMLDSTGAARIIYPEGGRGNIGVQIHQPPTQDQLQIVAHNLNKAAQAGVGDGSLVWDLKNSEGKMISGSGSIGDFRRAVDKAYPDQQDLISKELQPPHKETFGMQITDPDGTVHVAKVDAYTNNESLKVARKKFPDAAEILRLPEQDEPRVPSTAYEVPTGKLHKMKESMGRPEIDTIRHELGHVFEGAAAGMQQEGMWSSAHPGMPSDARAAIKWSGEGLIGPDGRFKPEKRVAVVQASLGAIAADEVFNDLPRAANHNFNIRAGGDGTKAYNLLRLEGYTHEAAMDRMHQMIDQSVTRLQHPAVASVIHENAGVREAGLSRQFHYSPERLNSMVAEANRRMTDEKYTEKHDTGPDDGQIDRGRQATNARREGGVSETTGREPQEGQITNAEKETSEPNLRNRPVVEQNGETTAARDIGESEAAATKPAETEEGIVSEEKRGKVESHPKSWKSLSDEYRIFHAPRGAVDAHHIENGGGWWLKGDGSWIGSLETPEGFTQEHQSILQNQLGNDLRAVRIAAPNTFDLGNERPSDAQLQELNRIFKQSEENEVVWHTLGGDGEGSYGDFLRDVQKHYPEDLVSEEKIKPHMQDVVDSAQWVEEPKTGYQRLDVRGPHGEMVGELEYSGGIGDEDSRIRKSYIEPEYRNQGIAKEMYKSAIENARAQGIKTFKSDTMVSNDAQHVWSSLMRDGQYNIKKIYTKNFSANGTGGVEYHVDLTGKPADIISEEKIKKAPKEMTPELAQQIVDAHEAAGGSTFNLTHGNLASTDNYAVSTNPERGLTLDHPPTAKEIQDFAAKNADLLKNPDKSLGTWHNTANDTHVLDVVSTISDRKKAIALGKKNNQIAIYHLGGEGEIPTGGTGVTPFEPSTGGTPEAPAAPPMPKASESLPLVSTRMPSKTVKGQVIEEHTNGALTSDMQAAAAAPGYLEKLADRVANTPGFKDPGGDAMTRTNAYIRHIADNVKFVWSKLTPEAIKHDEQWYPVGAHERGIEVAKQHAIDPHQAYAVTAALSPLTDWDQNTSQAERAVNIWKNQQNTKFTPEMKQAGKDIASIPAMKKFASKFKKLEGKTLGELTDVRDQALWLRLYDEGHNSRAYQTWNPDGTPAGIAKNQDGSPKAMGWSFQNLIEHAIDILKDGSQENISKVLGTGHKVRNFYNNQLAPDDPRFLTIDTHAVNVGQLRPMSGKTPAVKDNFGGISNKTYGLKGTYALHDAGYRLAAKELDIPIPSRLQSPTWVKIREVFPNKFKTPENQQAIDAIWKEHTDGKITIDDARNKIWDYAEGWNSRNAGGVGDTSDQGELFNVGLSGEPAGGAAGRGTGSDVAPANQEVAPEEDSSFNFGANVKPAEARSRTSKISATQRAKNDAMVKGLAGLIKSGKK